MYRLAHISDPHLGPMARPRLRELANKRITGYFNWRRGRDRMHDMDLLERLLDRHARAAAQPHRVHGRPHQYRAAWRVPDRADVPRKARSARPRQLRAGQPRRLCPQEHSAISSASRALDDLGQRPVRGLSLCQDDGPIAIVGTSSAVPTGPFIASGTLGREQRKTLGNVLAFLGQQPLARVVLIHHPPHRGGAKAGRGLTDATAFEEIMDKSGAELILHGHNHVTSMTGSSGLRARPDGGRSLLLGRARHAHPSCRLSPFRHRPHRIGNHDVRPHARPVEDGTIGDLGSLPL